LDEEKKNESQGGDPPAPENHGPADALVGRYEDLRRQALDEQARRCGELGHALFLRKGMAAWMDGWTRCTPRDDQRRTSLAAASDPVPHGLHSELVMVLVTMALSHLQEVMR